MRKSLRKSLNKKIIDESAILRKRRAFVVIELTINMHIQNVFLREVTESGHYVFIALITQ